MLNIHHLELFYYVARHRGITQAVRQMPYGIQQPAMSAQLLQLERAIGTTLFRRRPFSLTPAGKELWEFVSPFFGGLEQAEKRIKGEASSQLRLAAAGAILREHLPSLLKQLHRKHPQLRLSLREASHADAERLLNEQEVDLALVLMESKITGSWHSTELLKLPLVLVTPKSAAWTGATQILEAGSEGKLALISPQDKDLLGRLFQGELLKRGLHWPVTIEATSLDVVDAYVLQGFGVGLGLDIPDHPPGKGLRTHALKGFPSVSVAALWQGKLSAPGEACLAILKERSRELNTR